MAGLTFVDNDSSQTITAAWLNAINDFYYDTLGAPTTDALVVSGLGITASIAELNVLAGIPATLTATELGYVDGVTSAIQTQMDLKAPAANPTFTGTVVIPTPFTLGAVSVTPTGTELNYVDGVTSAIQTQIDTKLAFAKYGSQINGWTYSNGTDATNDIDIAAGSGLDSTRAYFITGAASTKQLDAAWAVGSAAGGLDTGSIGNSDYYIWVIARSDTGVVDYLFSLSSTAPTMPASYDFKRLIGWFKRVSATIIAFHTYETEGGGIEMNWDAPTLDVNLSATLTTTRRTDAVKVPLNFSTLANLDVYIQDASAAAVVNLCCPDQTDAAPVLTLLANISTSTGITSMVSTFNIRTSATGTIAARSDLATVDNYRVATVGFTWARRV